MGTLKGMSESGTTRTTGSTIGTTCESEPGADGSGVWSRTSTRGTLASVSTSEVLQEL